MMQTILFLTIGAVVVLSQTTAVPTTVPSANIPQSGQKFPQSGQSMMAGKESRPESMTHEQVTTPLSTTKKLQKRQAVNVDDKDIQQCVDLFRKKIEKKQKEESSGQAQTADVQRDITTVSSAGIQGQSQGISEQSDVEQKALIDKCLQILKDKFKEKLNLNVQAPLAGNVAAALPELASKVEDFRKCQDIFQALVGKKEQLSASGMTRENIQAAVQESGLDVNIAQKCFDLLQQWKQKRESMSAVPKSV